MARVAYNYTFELTVVELWPQEMESDDDAAAIAKAIYTWGIHHDDGSAIIAAKIVGKFPVVYP